MKGPRYCLGDAHAWESLLDRCTGLDFSVRATEATGGGEPQNYYWEEIYLEIP